MKIRPPIFLLGVTPYTGINYLSDLLLGHPGLEAPGVLAQDHIMENAHLLLEYAEKTCTRWKGLPWFNEPEEWRGVLVRHLSQSILELLAAQSSGSRRLVVQTTAAHNIETLLQVFPGASVVILVRDGRDEVASALRASPDQRYDVSIRQWAEAARSVRHFMHVSAGLKGKSWDLVKFEELMEEPGAVVASLFRFLEIDPGLYAWEHIEQKSVGLQHSINKQEVRQGHLKKCAWTDWGWYRKRVFKGIAGQELVNFGYASDQGW